MTEIIDTLLSKLTVIRKKKGDFLLREGDVCNTLIYIKKGVTRHFILNSKGEEHTKNFTQDDHFTLGSISSFFTQRPSVVQLQALTDIEYYELPYHELLRLKNEDSFKALWDKMICTYIVKKEEKEISAMQLSGKDRYLKFLDTFPGIINIIPHYYIASYLNMNPETLSRIRKKLLT